MWTSGSRGGGRGASLGRESMLSALVPLKGGSQGGEGEEGSVRWQRTPCLVGEPHASSIGDSGPEQPLGEPEKMN